VRYTAIIKRDGLNCKRRAAKGAPRATYLIGSSNSTAPRK
jgi:hypothetical protein